MRAPFQVLVLPYFFDPVFASVKYCLFKRQDMNIWQGIAGGGEDAETPLQAAIREASEEAGIIGFDSKFMQLAATASIPAEAIGGLIWGPEVTAVPEYSFGVELPTQDIQIAREHSTYAWFSFEEALTKLHFESNKIALTELNHELLISL